MKLIVIIIVLVLFLFTLMVYGFNFLSFRSSYSCDVGENATAGDNKLTSSDWYNKWFNERSCAIEDCAVYNKIQKELGSELRCVV